MQERIGAHFTNRKPELYLTGPRKPHLKTHSTKQQREECGCIRHGYEGEHFVYIPYYTPKTTFFQAFLEIKAFFVDYAYILCQHSYVNQEYFKVKNFYRFKLFCNILW